MRSPLKTQEVFYLLSTYLSLFVIGWSDGTTGPLIPRIQTYYNIDYVVLSMIFICSCVGCTSAAFMNMWIMDEFGLGKTITVGAALQTISFTIQSFRPPFPLVAFSYTIAGFGWSLVAAQGDTFVATLRTGRHAKMMIGHGCFGLGALVAPLVSTQFARYPKLWSLHYVVSLGFSILSTLFLAAVFRFKDEKAILCTLYNEQETEAGTTENESKGLRKYQELMRLPIVHSVAAFGLLYVGMEVTMGAWSVSLLIHKRNGGPSSGYVSSGFYGGLTLGRFALIPITKAIGETTSVFVYGVVCIGLELTVWLVPSLRENAIAISFVGFFMGPIYPTCITMLSRNVASRYLGGAIGWVSCNGSLGAAALPFILAVMADKLGVQVLQPLMIGLLVGMLLMWTAALMFRPPAVQDGVSDGVGPLPDLNRSQVEGGRFAQANDC